MENETKDQPLTEEAFLLFMHNIAEEQKQNSQAIYKLTKDVNGIGEQLKNMPAPKTATTSFKDAQLIKIMCELQDGVDLLQRPVINKNQVLLFPEQDRELFYKIVFGRWLICIVIMLIITNCYKYAVNYSNNQKEIEIRQIEEKRFKREWYRIYNNSDKAKKKAMENEFFKD